MLHLVAFHNFVNSVRIVKAKEAHVYSNIMMRIQFQKKQLLVVFQSFVNSVKVANIKVQHAFSSIMIPKMFLKQDRKTKNRPEASHSFVNSARVANIKVQLAYSNIMMLAQFHKKLLLVVLIKFVKTVRAASTNQQLAFSSITIPIVLLQQDRKTKNHQVASLNSANSVKIAKIKV